MSIKGYPMGEWRLLPDPRVAPLPPSQRNWIHNAILRMSRSAAGARNDLYVIETFLRLGVIAPLYLLWLSRLLFKGKINRAEKEKIVLRTAWRVGCVYEWTHHVHLALKAGVRPEEIATLAEENSGNWTPRLRVFIRAVDELLANRILGDRAWRSLREHLSEDQCIEFCMLCGHYAMVSMILNATGIRVEPEFSLGSPSAAAQTWRGDAEQAGGPSLNSARAVS